MSAVLTSKELQEFQARDERLGVPNTRLYAFIASLQGQLRIAEVSAKTQSEIIGDYHDKLERIEELNTAQREQLAHEVANRKEQVRRKRRGAEIKTKLLGHSRKRVVDLEKVLNEAPHYDTCITQLGTERDYPCNCFVNILHQALSGEV